MSHFGYLFNRWRWPADTVRSAGSTSRLMNADAPSCNGKQANSGRKSRREICLQAKETDVFSRSRLRASALVWWMTNQNENTCISFSSLREIYEFIWLHRRGKCDGRPRRMRASRLNSSIHLQVATCSTWYMATLLEQLATVALLLDSCWPTTRWQCPSSRSAPVQMFYGYP